MTRPSEAVPARLASSPAHPQGRNLILGVAESMSWKQIEPFVLSLRQTRFDGDVLFYVADLDATTIRALRSAGIAMQEMRRLRVSAFGRQLFPYDPQLARLHARYPRLIETVSALSRDPTLMAAGLASSHLDTRCAALLPVLPISTLMWSCVQECDVDGRPRRPVPGRSVRLRHRREAPLLPRGRPTDTCDRAIQPQMASDGIRPGDRG